MELWQLEVFKAVADEKSFSRAGARLGRTQPAISSAIKTLEEELGEPLFDRQGKTVRLTAAGDLLTSYSQRILNLARRSGSSRRRNARNEPRNSVDWCQ